MEINLNQIKISENFRLNILDLLWFLVIPLININYLLAGHIAKSGYDLTIKLDDIVKFNSLFIIPYIYWYAYIVIGFIFILAKSRRDYMRAFLAFFIGMSICYIIYYVFPTQMNRPIVENSNIFNRLVNLIYSADRPFNCFPSLHVLTTYYIMRYTKYSNSKKVFYYTQIAGVLIIISTVFVKQHFVLDIIGAIILCEVIMLFINKIKNENIDKILDFPFKVKEKITEKIEKKSKLSNS